MSSIFSKPFFISIHKYLFLFTSNLACTALPPPASADLLPGRPSNHHFVPPGDEYGTT
jgi:hypothetical protein